MKYTTIVLASALALASCSSSNDASNSTSEGAVTTDNNNQGEGSTDTGAESGTETANGITTAGNEPLALDLIGQDFLVSLAGFQADRLSLSVRALAVEIATAGEATPQQDSTFETLDGFGPETVVTPTQIISYTCNAGGQMLHETGRLSDGVDTERSMQADYDAFTFDACSHTGSGGLFDAGNYQLNGKLVMEATDYSVSRGSRSSHSNTWTDFSMVVPGDVKYDISGSVLASAFSAANFGSGDLRTVELPIYRKTESTQVAESLQDAFLSLTRTIPNGGDDSGYELKTNGTIVNPTTGALSVTVTSDPSLSGRNLFSQNVFEPFSGQIRMVASDTSELILSANPASIISTAPGDLLVDLVAQSAAGESTTTESVELIDILSGAVKSFCFLNDSSADDCDAVLLP